MSVPFTQIFESILYLLSLTHTYAHIHIPLASPSLPPPSLYMHMHTQQHTYDRSDIPKHLKDDIKHNLQNKLHRCAGPEDLVTAERIWVCSRLPVGVLVCTRS